MFHVSISVIAVIDCSVCKDGKKIVRSHTFFASRRGLYRFCAPKLYANDEKKKLYVLTVSILFRFFTCTEFLDFFSLSIHT